MSVLASVGKGESCRIGEATRCTMDDLGNEGERLQCPRAEPLNQQQRCKIAEFPFVSNRQYGTESFQVDVFGANIVMRRHRQFARFAERGLHRLLCDGEQRLLRPGGAAIDQVQNLALRLTENRRVGVGDKIPDACGVPVVAAGGAILRVHPLLHNGPLAVSGDDEGMQVKLKTVGHGIVVHAGGKAAGSRKRVSIESRFQAEAAKLIGSAYRVPSAPAAHHQPEFVEPWVEPALQRTHDRGRNAGRVPVHPHDCAEGLKPERIAEAREEIIGAVFQNNVLSDGRAQLRHTIREPWRNSSAV